jgi:hypothetical protein
MSDDVCQFTADDAHCVMSRDHDHLYHLMSDGRKIDAATGNIVIDGVLPLPAPAEDPERARLREEITKAAGPWILTCGVTLDQKNETAAGITNAIMPLVDELAARAHHMRIAAELLAGQVQTYESERVGLHAELDALRSHTPSVRQVAPTLGVEEVDREWVTTAFLMGALKESVTRESARNAAHAMRVAGLLADPVVGGDSTAPETPWEPKVGQPVIGKLWAHPDDEIGGVFVRHSDEYISRIDVGSSIACAVLRSSLRPAGSVVPTDSPTDDKPARCDVCEDEFSNANDSGICALCEDATVDPYDELPEDGGIESPPSPAAELRDSVLSWLANYQPGDLQRAISDRIDEIQATVLAEPNACRYCGIPERTHYRQIASPERGGAHTWVEPTDAQRKERMLARRVMRGQAAAR